MRAAGLPILLVVVTVLAAALPAAGQGLDPNVQIDLGVTPHGQPLPMGSSATVPVEVTVRCPPFSVFSGPVLIALSAASAVEWMMLEVEPSTLTVEFGPSDCLNDPAPVSLSARVTVTAQVGAPAYLPATLTVSARQADTDGSTAATWEEVVAMEGDFAVSLAGSYEEADGRGTIRGTLTNNANGPIEVHFRVVEEPSRGSVQVPPRIVVPSRATDGNGTASFAIVLEQAGRGAIGMTVQLQAFAADNATHQVPPVTELRVLAEPRAGTVKWTTDPDETLASPALGPLLVLLLLGAAVAVYRHRRPV